MVSSSIYTYVIDLDFLTRTQGHTQSCEYSNTMCRQCGLNIRSKALSSHQAVECPMRLVKCLFCGKMVLAGQTEVIFIL